MNIMYVNKICGSTNNIHKQRTDVQGSKHIIIISACEEMTR